ncbi:unnamed protein product [Cuscuta campestris]|uniref:Oxidoreductase FAD/NAD(P)-binding domain-containing protein n=1 Tax=Cuscuta campestris TaxID=132261 RepID=A0A484LB70_9ASTE|nr:unnamed protein product [Cuscuta campestris]
MLAGGPISWKSHKQELTATSTMMAEYIALYNATCHGMLLRNLITGLKVVNSISRPLKLYCDNSAAVSFSNSNSSTGAALYLDTKYLFVRELIPAWFSKGSLPPPPPSLPLILVGPGTGCAPFCGFIEERALQRQSGNNPAPVIFFFGCRNEENDFLYRDFWQSHSESGKVLCEEQGGGFFVAFSRDQPQKVYVQHKMREQSVKVWNLLAEGAAVYCAGSASKMPSDVLSALEEIVSEVTGRPL